ncbi:MAG: tyrosine-type recombinase/integrase [Tepidiformaceae bacterium]
MTLQDGRRKLFTARTRKEAKDKLAQFEEQKRAGFEWLDSKQTVAQFLTRWLNDDAKQSVRPSTFASYESNVRTRIVPALGQMALSSLTGQHIEALLGVLRERRPPLSPASLVRTHAVLHRALEKAVRWKLIPRNPADDVTRPRIPKAEMKTLAPTEVTVLIETARSSVMRALYAVAATSGLRRGELLGLRWADLDVDQGYLSVTRTLQKPKGGGFEFLEPKTHRGRRRVRLASLALRELKSHRASQVEARLLAGPLWRDHDLVFASSVGTPLEPAWVSRTFGADLYRAGLPRVRLHDLRHTAATTLLAQQVHPKVVQEMLGHANIAVTLDTYSHVTPDMQEAAVAALDKVYG